MVTCLKKNKYETFEASNGEKALEILDKNYIDLVITDIMMQAHDDKLKVMIKDYGPSYTQC